MGIVTLKSSLDTAIQILDYQLSRAKNTTAHNIYTYRISHLKEKILKTHKKSVTSPIPVSPNKYTSLVVEDIHQQTDPCSVQAVQQITADYSKVPSITDLYRKQTKKLAYKPYLKISPDLLCTENKPFTYQV